MHFKSIFSLLFSSLLIFGLSGCGNGAAYMEDNTPHQSVSKYDIDAFVGSIPVVHSHVTLPADGSTLTYKWEQKSGTLVTLSPVDGPTTTFTMPNSTIVLKLTVTNTKTGAFTIDLYTINPITPQHSALQVLVSAPATVNSGDPASLHASVAGGTAPYIYNWRQTSGTTVTLDLTHPSAPRFTAPTVTTQEVLHFEVTVTDSTGITATAIETITILPSTPHADKPPVIKITGTNPLTVLMCSTYSDAGATANDLEDGDITSKITKTGTVDPKTAGTYKLIYTVTDSAGHSATATRVVNVVTTLRPSNVVKKTGQAKSHDENGVVQSGCQLKDDGSYMLGAAPHYTRSNDMVTDNVTGLIWEDTPHTADPTQNISMLQLWNGKDGTAGGPAETYCTGLKLGGLKWRLPEIWELLTIADKSRHNPAIDPIFKYIVADQYSPARWYWTKTPKQETNIGTTTQYNYTVKFYDGRDEAGLIGAVGNPLSVRCVSGKASGIGLAPSSRSFTRDSTNDIVTDNITSLQWTDDAGTAGENGTWREAINYCETLTHGGFTDWRLPNVNEWYTIVKNTGLKEKESFYPEFHSIIGDHHKTFYWTSTTYNELKHVAWLIGFYVGSDTTSTKDVSLNLPKPPGENREGPHKVMCVRNK
jgi:hypothetical protein